MARAAARHAARIKALRADKRRGRVAPCLGIGCVPRFHRPNNRFLPFKTLSFEEGSAHG
jgi:hypothetical protein